MCSFYYLVKNDSERASRSAFFDIIKRFESGKSAKHHDGCGCGCRRAKIFKRELKRLSNNKDGVSQRKLAGRFQ